MCVNKYLTTGLEISSLNLNILQSFPTEPCKLLKERVSLNTFLTYLNISENKEAEMRITELGDIEDTDPTKMCECL